MKTNACHECIFAGRPPVARTMRDFQSGWPTMLSCVNHPECPGELRDVLPNAAACRNFRLRPKPPLRLTPPPPPAPGVRYIALTKGKFAIVDAADYDWLSHFRWHATGSRGRYYAATVIDGKSISMHRMIMNPPPGEVTDHHDGNGLNNSRPNLRNCTPDENRHNTRPPRKKGEHYIGVYPRGDKWMFKIARQGKLFYGGPFDTPIQAAKARDKKAKELFGDYAWLNFPDKE